MKMVIQLLLSCLCCNHNILEAHAIGYTIIVDPIRDDCVYLAFL